MAKKPEILDLNDQIRSVLTFRIRGISPLVQNRFYNKEGIRSAHAGDRTKNRAPRDPAAECANAAHKLTNGGYGFPADGLKGSVIEAAHIDIGLPKTLLKKSFFILADDPVENLCALDFEGEPIMREDRVVIGKGSTDLRYRPQFDDWGIIVRCEFDADAVPPKTLLKLVNRAGFGVGLGEMRPQKGKSFGRYEVDPAYPINIVRLEPTDFLDPTEIKEVTNVAA
jgi:hypothetical protein|tara:strand:+ start:151 stop:825 length:675 start_codon:yes stop_codon:yes gene_type:complete